MPVTWHGILNYPENWIFITNSSRLSFELYNFKKTNKMGRISNFSLKLNGSWSRYLLTYVHKYESITNSTSNYSTPYGDRIELSRAGSGLSLPVGSTASSQVIVMEIQTQATTAQQTADNCKHFIQP